MVFEGYVFAFSWEVTLMTWIQSVLPSKVIELLGWFSAFGEELILVAFIGTIFWCVNKEYGRRIGITISVGMVLNPMIKNVFYRRRPYFDNPGIDCYRPVEKGADLYDIAEQGYSFPSGHSTNAAAAYGVTAKLLGKRWVRVLAWILTILVGLSRIVVGCHYPTDVLCGWLLGLGCVFLVDFMYKKIENHWIIVGIWAVVGLVGCFYCKTYDFFSSYGILMGILLSEPFDKKFVNFEMPDKVWKAILRVLVGGAVYMGLNTLLKLPFPKEFLEGGTTISFVIKAIRYLVVSFVTIGVYPMCFKLFKNKKGE